MNFAPWGLGLLPRIYMRAGACSGAASVAAPRARPGGCGMLARGHTAGYCTGVGQASVRGVPTAEPELEESMKTLKLRSGVAAG